MIKVGVVGASGYTGAELIRLLACHSESQVVAATAETFAGQKLSDIYPALGTYGAITLTRLIETDLSPQAVDVIFLGLPHGESMNLAPQLVKSGVKVIDLSGDFRFSDTLVYETWYKRKHNAKEMTTKAVYGLPELFRDEIKAASLVANPGCYATAAILALYPLLKIGAVEPNTLIVDAKSGISGAGRKAKLETQFNRVSENVIPYKMVGTHQHTPEMEQVLNRSTGQEVVITFSPQMVPARRGIVTLIYGRLLGKYTLADLEVMFTEVYQKEPFIRLQPAEAAWPDLSSAVGTNCCVLKVALDERTGLVVAASAIDNLIKGASGQAIQNMNLMFGLDETLGLPSAGLIP